jgi:DNA helicase-2/ATP-dependent DNA helicase PcrA
MKKWTDGLNPEQVQAVLHNEGPLLILAGAGSGKTTVLVARTGRLISENVVRPENMAVLTFTNKAARELKTRVGKRIGEAASQIWTGTFHGFGLQMVKTFTEEAGLEPQFGILDSSDSSSLVRELLKETKSGAKAAFDPDRLLNIINAKRSKQALVAVEDEYEDMAEVLKEKYEKKLKLLNVVDFESLLLLPLEMMKKHPHVLERIRKRCHYLMVDEFQDTNFIQMEWIRMLWGDSQNIAVVGDDDQSIYGWRGALVSNILDFPKEFKKCEVIKLDRNYRSNEPILTLANQAIQFNEKRHGKLLRPEKVYKIKELPEVFVFDNESEEATGIVRELQDQLRLGKKPGDLAILYRSNSQGAYIEGELRKNRIPYQITGGTSIFERKEAKDVMTYLEQSIKPHDLGLKRILNVPNRGLGDVALEKLVETSKAHKQKLIQTLRTVETAGLNLAAQESVKEFLEFLKTLPEEILKASHEPGSVTTAWKSFFEKLGYFQYLQKDSLKSETAQGRWIRVEIVGRILENHLIKNGFSRESIKEFVEKILLRMDDEDEDRSGFVQMMTLHASKGLEFPVVILAGLEEDLLPHKTLGGHIEEERRLFYVGVTRAQERLMMTRCRARLRYGQLRPVSPSRFLVQLDRNLYVEHEHGVRPWKADERANMVGDFLKKLDKTQKP